MTNTRFYKAENDASFTNVFLNTLSKHAPKNISQETSWWSPFLLNVAGSQLYWKGNPLEVFSYGIYEILIPTITVIVTNNNTMLTKHDHRAPVELNVY